jgi:hypothetical protein
MQDMHVPSTTRGGVGSSSHAPQGRETFAPYLQGRETFAPRTRTGMTTMTTRTWTRGTRSLDRLS